MSERQYAMPHDLPVATTPLEGNELAMFEQGGQLVQAPYSALTGEVAEHAEKHQIDGEDPIGTLDNISGGIPYLDTNGMLDTRVSDATTTTKGKVQLATDGEEDATKAVSSTDSRLSDARTPTAHASEHVAGSDVIPDATVTVPGLMSAADKVKADATIPENIPTADQKAALAGSYGTPGAANRFVTESDPVLSSIGGGGGGTTGPDLLGIGQIGNGLSLAVGARPALAQLNSTDTAFIFGSSGELRCYTFNGADWTQKGNGLLTANTGSPALADLNSTDVALIDSTNAELRCYTFDGTNWTQKGNGLSIANTGTPALAGLNSTDIAFIDSTYDELRCYTFDGTNWTQKGNRLLIVYAGKPALASLSSTDVAFIDDYNDELRCYTFNGTNWTQKGNGLSIANTGTPALASLSSTDVAFIDSANDELRTYNFLFGYDSASVNIVSDYEVPELTTGKSIVIRRTSAYDGDPVTISPPSGATFEGLSEYLLYEQYSSVTLERISSTVFAIQDEKINKLSEVGEIKPFASTVPKGFKACDGSAISRTTFPVLFAAIGTTFGAGNGSTTFNLPDLRETVLVGTGTRGSGVTEHDTYTLGQFKDDQMQGHRHRHTNPNGASVITTAYVNTAGTSGAGITRGLSGEAGTDFSIINPVTDGVNGTPRTGSTTHGKQIGVNYAIRYA